MTKPPLTHQNLAGSTSPARVQLLSLQSTSAPSSWLRATRCPDMFPLQQFVSCGFLQWLLYCSISSGLPGSPQETRRCRISSGVVHQAVQSCPQRSFAADSSSLQSRASCSCVQACTETQTWPSGQRDCKWVEGRAGTDQFWHDTKRSGRATGGQSKQQRSVNLRSPCDISEHGTDCLQR